MNRSTRWEKCDGNISRSQYASIRGLYQNTKYTLSQLAARFHTTVDQVEQIVLTVHLSPRAPRLTIYTPRELKNREAMRRAFPDNAPAEDRSYQYANRLHPHHAEKLAKGEYT